MSEVLCYTNRQPGVIICTVCVTEAESSEEAPGIEPVLRSDEGASKIAPYGVFCVRCGTMIHESQTD